MAYETPGFMGWFWVLEVLSLVGMLWTRGMRCKKSPKTRAGCFGW